MRIKAVHIWLLIVLLSVACSPEFIDQPERLVVKVDSNVYSRPEVDGKPIITLKAGTEVFLLESENDWHRIELPDGRTGWIFRGITRSVGREKIVTIRDARIRRGPGEEYNAFAIVKKGKLLEARGERGNWYLVDLTDGKSGWISKKDAEKTSRRNLTAIKTAKIYQLPDPNSRFLITVRPGTELIQLYKKGNYFMVRLPGGDTGWIHQDDVEVIRERAIKVTGRTYIRTGPDIGYDVIDTVDVGTRLTLLSQRENWFEVRTPRGIKGWVYKDFITTTQTGTGATPDEMPIYVMTNRDCNIRQGYGTNWPKITRVKKGTLLLKIGERDNWLRIKMHTERIGWVREDLVTYEVEILITLEECNIRKGPSTSFIRIDRVPKGTPLVKITEQDGWTRVYLVDGRIGWIYNPLFAKLDKMMFANQDCNVRKGPGVSFERIGRIPYGTFVLYLDKERNWYKVKIPDLKDKIGYIREDLLDKTGNQWVTTQQVNIRYGPATTFRLIRKVPKNTVLEKLEEQDGWYRIKLPDGKIGWVFKKYVAYSFYPVPKYRPLRREGDNLIADAITPSSGTVTTKPFIGSIEPGYTPIPEDVGVFTLPGIKAETVNVIRLRTEPDLNASVITTLPPGTELTQLSKAGEWYEVMTIDGTEGWVHQSAFGIQKTRTLYANTKANIRYGPSRNYKIVAVVQKGEPMTNLQKRDNWYNVKLANGVKGWIREDLVDVERIPTPVLTEVTPEPAFGAAVTVERTRLYRGPGKDFPIVKNLPQNTHLTIIGKYRDWSQVMLFSREEGWVYNEAIEEKFHWKIITIRTAEVHETTNTQSRLIKTVKMGRIFRPLNEKNGWYRVFLDARLNGWISGDDVKKLKYPPVYVNHKTANVRRLPSLKSPKVAVVNEGDKLMPEDDYNGWLFVKLPRGDRGWIRQDLVNRQKQPWLVIKKDTEVYEKPTAGSILIDRVSKNDKFLGLDKNENWYKIYLESGKVGWIYAGFVEEDIKGTILVKRKSNLRMGPGLEYRIITQVPKGEQVKWLAEKNKWRQVQVNSGEIGWILVDLGKNIPLKKMTARQNATVYKGPGSNYPIVGRVIKNKKYIPLEKKNNWYRIQLSTGIEGWVPVDAFTAPKSRIVFTLDVAKIRKGPGIQYDTIVVVEPATDVKILGSENDWYYVEVQKGDKPRGYIRKELVFE